MTTLTLITLTTLTERVIYEELKMDNEENRCVNVPSWSLPIALINDVSVSADVLAVSQSSIVKVALEEWFKRNPMKEENDSLQCEK